MAGPGPEAEDGVEVAVAMGEGQGRRRGSEGAARGKKSQSGGAERPEVGFRVEEGENRWFSR
jgi:hypothetical protein